MKVSGSKFIILILYVNDILLATNDFDMLHETKNFLSKNFEMKDMGEASYVIGIEYSEIDHVDCWDCLRKHILIKSWKDLEWKIVLEVLSLSKKEISLVSSNVQ